MFLVFQNNEPAVDMENQQLTDVSYMEIRSLRYEPDKNPQAESELIT